MHGGIVSAAIGDLARRAFALPVRSISNLFGRARGSWDAAHGGIVAAAIGDRARRAFALSGGGVPNLFSGAWRSGDAVHGGVVSAAISDLAGRAFALPRRSISNLFGRARGGGNATNGRGISPSIGHLPGWALALLRGRVPNLLGGARRQRIAWSKSFVARVRLGGGPKSERNDENRHDEPCPPHDPSIPRFCLSRRWTPLSGENGPCIAEPDGVGCKAGYSCNVSNVCHWACGPK
jgi:hypothetical protein